MTLSPAFAAVMMPYNGCFSLGAQWVAESRSTGIVNTTDRSVYDARLKNSALADGQEPLIWAWIHSSVGVCQILAASPQTFTLYREMRQPDPGLEWKPSTLFLLVVPLGKSIL
ncbi:hypothetical protein H671_5g14492 [Cricetulus griseus]|nr:hypothetical protein H671_5g14492 [Cricetulus griseus]